MSRLTDQDNLYLHAMGRAFRITAIFTTEEEANEYLSQNKEEGVIKELSNGLILIADKRDTGAWAYR